MNLTKPALGSTKPLNKHHIKSFGRGENAAEQAEAYLNKVYDEALKHFKRKPTLDLFLAGTCPPDKLAAVTWSIVAYGDNLEEVAFMRGET